MSWSGSVRSLFTRASVAKIWGTKMKSLNCEHGLVDLDVLVRVLQKIIETKNNVFGLDL